MCQDIKAKPVGFSSRTAHDHRRPLCAAKRGILFSFSQLTPLTPTLSPPVRGEGEDSKWGRKPRVPLALHPGLLIFHP